MDRIDFKILSLLAGDGRLSFREIGEQVHLSPNAVADRYRRLRATGVIRHIRASFDAAALGRPLEAQIDVKLSAGTAAARFEEALRDMPQVVSAALMTGSFDYAVRVACVDRDDLIRVAETLRGTAGAQETYSRVILREIDIGPRQG